MTIPARPDIPVLWGDTQEDKEHSRTSDSIQITWSLVADADSYEIAIDNGNVVAAAPGVRVTSLRPNVRYLFQIRAVNVDGKSDWSPNSYFTTRPPKPPQATRLPYDLALWGISLSWNIPSTNFPGEDRASVRLLRAYEEGVWSKATEGALKGTYVDLDDPQQRQKLYALQIVAPAPVTNETNVSELSEEISVKGTFCFSALVPTKPIDWHMSRTRTLLPALFNIGRWSL